jgi:FAD binding domain/Berberine and berberine like
MRRVATPSTDDSTPHLLDRREFLCRSGTMGLAAALAGQAGWLTACSDDGDASTPSRRRSPSDRAWRQLAAMLDGALILPGTSTYPTTALPSNLVYSGVRPPGIVQPANATDVSRTVRWAREEGIPTVARSGGHSYAGYSTTATGVVVDLSTLATIDLDPDTGIATIGAGAALGDVDDATTPAGFVVPAGRCRPVGIAGLLLGGGFGFNSRSFGLTSDNLVSTDLVTADGERLTVDGDTHPDLSWALRGGGGGNFGINTVFRVRAHRVGAAASYSLTWTDPGVFVPAWSALQDLTAGAPDGFSLHLGITVQRRSSGSPGTAVQVIGQYLGTADELRQILAPAFDVATPANVTVQDGDLASATTFLSTAGTPDAFLTKSAFCDAISDDGLGVLFDHMTRFPQAGRVGDFKVIASGGAVQRIAPDATAFVHRSGAYLNEGDASWTPDAGRRTIDACTAWLQSLYVAMAPYLSRRAYQNFIDPTLRDWERAYYGENLGRLVDVKRRIDPDDYFRFAQSIPTRH